MLLFDFFSASSVFFPLFFPVIFSRTQFGWTVGNIYASAMIHRLSIDDALCHSPLPDWLVLVDEYNSEEDTGA